MLAVTFRTEVGNRQPFSLFREMQFVDCSCFCQSVWKHHELQCTVTTNKLTICSNMVCTMVCTVIWYHVIVCALAPPTLLLRLLDQVEGCPVLNRSSRVEVLCLHCNGAPSWLTQLAQLYQRGAVFLGWIEGRGRRRKMRERMREGMREEGMKAGRN